MWTATHSGRRSGTCQLSPNSLVLAAGLLSGFKLSSFGFLLKFPAEGTSTQTHHRVISQHSYACDSILIWTNILTGMCCLNRRIKRITLTAHATEQAVVGVWHSDISVVVSIETHPQAKVCLQDNKLSTQEDFNTTDGTDRWDNHCAVDLKRRKVIIGMAEFFLISLSDAAIIATVINIIITSISVTVIIVIITVIIFLMFPMTWPLGTIYIRKRKEL